MRSESVRCEAVDLFQDIVTLSQRPRGVHLVRSELADARGGVSTIEAGIAHRFLQDTSAWGGRREGSTP